MSLTNLFKLRVIQFIIRHMPIRRQFNTSSLHFRHALLPALSHRISLPSTVYKHFIPPTPLTMLSHRQTRSFSDDEPPPTWEGVNKSALDILASFDKISSENVSLESHFINDLGLDSLDIVEIVMAFEDVFDVEITDDELETIFSGQDAVDLVGKKLEIPYPEPTL